jgi:hypothetical protein
MRAIDLDMCHGGETIFTYTKLGRFVILGFINEPNPNHWVGGRVNANEGSVEPRHYVMPAQFGTYLMGKAELVRESMQGISDRQRTKIDKAFRANADSIVGSDFFEAMQADVEMFSPAAFTPRKDQEGER